MTASNDKLLLENVPMSGRMINEAGESANIADSLNPWEEWPGAGVDGAPHGLPKNTVGFDQDGIGASTMYWYSAARDEWDVTAQTRDGFLGL